MGYIKIIPLLTGGIIIEYLELKKIVYTSFFSSFNFSNKYSLNFGF